MTLEDLEQDLLVARVCRPGWYGGGISPIVEKFWLIFLFIFFVVLLLIRLNVIQWHGSLLPRILVVTEVKVVVVGPDYLYHVVPVCVRDEPRVFGVGHNR